MSLLNELNLTEQEWKQASPTLRDRILEKYARITGLSLVQTQQTMNRDSRRLNAKARAAYKKLGLQLPDEDQETIILGDNNQPQTLTLPTAIVLVVGGLLAMLLVLLMAALLTMLIWHWLGAGEPVDTDTITNVVPGFGDPNTP